MTKKIILGAVVVAVAIIAFFVGKNIFSSQTVVSGTTQQLIEQYDPYVRYAQGIRTNYPIFAQGGFQISTTGTLVNRLNTGTCYIQPYATTIAATSTGVVDCQATAAVGSTNTANDVALVGVTAGDNVVATLSTSTAGTLSGGLHISGASASTTPGFIQLNVVNLTGTTFTWPTTGAASGTVSYFDSH